MFRVYHTSNIISVRFRIINFKITDALVRRAPENIELLLLGKFAAVGADLDILEDIFESLKCAIDNLIGISH